MNPSLSSRRIAAVFFCGLLLLLCLIYIYRSFQWGEIAAILAGVNLPWLFGGVGLSALLYWLMRTLRWFVMLKSENIHIKFSQLYMCSAITVGLSVITPFQSGEMLKVEWMKEHGLLDRMPGYASFMVERIVDLFVLCAIAAVGLLFNFSASRASALKLVVVLMAIPPAALFLLNRFSLRGHLGRFVDQIRRFVNDGKVLLSVVFLTVASWLMVAVGWQICLRSVSIEIAFRDCLTLVSTVTLVNIASFIPGAIGISEVGVTEYLLYLGQAPAAAQTGAIMVRLHSLLILCFAAMHLLLWRIRPYFRPSPVDHQ